MMPLSGWWCFLGWCLASALFVGLVAFFGGPSHLDIRQSVYGTWGIAHGHIACAYPSVNIPNDPPPAPVYLLLSGGIAAITRIGQAVPFSSAGALGPSCDHAFVQMDRWSVQAGALGPTAWIGCIGWLALLAGVVTWLRASGRGRCGWEPATLVLAACVFPVWMCVQNTFHPTRSVGSGACALCHGVRLPRKVDRRWDPRCFSGPLPAIRAPCGDTAPCACSSQAKDFVCRSGPYNGCARQPSLPGDDGGSRSARHHAGHGQPPIHGWDGALGVSSHWSPGCAGLPGRAHRCLGGVVVVGVTTARPCRSPAGHSDLLCGGFTGSSSRLRSELVRVLLHGSRRSAALGGRDSCTSSRRISCVASRGGACVLSWKGSIQSCPLGKFGTGNRTQRILSHFFSSPRRFSPSSFVSSEAAAVPTRWPGWRFPAAHFSPGPATSIL